MLKKLATVAMGLTLAGVVSSQASAAPILQAGDPIVAIWNTLIGSNSTDSTAGTGSAGQYPAAEAAPNAIDGNTATKYLNFGSGGGAAVSTPFKGVGTGFYVTPAAGATIAKSFRFTTANDAPLRDPTGVAIEGSNSTGADLKTGANWTLIFAGNAGLDTDPGRFTNGQTVSFTNTTAYTSYRVLIMSQRGNANSTQYSEFQLDTAVPEPSTMVLAGMGAIGLIGLVIKRRKS